MRRTVVLGIGNLLLRDEGVGVHLAQHLLGSPQPEGTTVVDIGTAILDALPHLEEADRVILVDAVKAEGVPGSIYRMPFDDFERPQCIASMHGFDMSRVLALAGGNHRPEVIVIGVEPSEIGWGLELSPAVAEAFPHLVETVRREIECAAQRPGTAEAGASA